MVGEVLTARALGRATLARQLLLERAEAGVSEAVARVGGLQAQTPHSWYLALWSRIAGFDPKDAAALLEKRELVRIALMRGTIHLVTAEDCLAWRPLHDDLIFRVTRSAFGRHWRGVDVGEVAAAGRALLEARPLTFAELGRELYARFSAGTPQALSQLVRAVLPLVQVPPRGLWGRGGPVAHTTAEHWLGSPLQESPSLEDFVARYLAAFGPATVKDVQAHCGLTRLREVLERMDLRTFRTEGGLTLYDLPDAPRPPEDFPSPVRFLPDFDNLFLSFADRARTGVLDPSQAARAWPAHGPIPGAVLVDGTVQATWSSARHRGTTLVTVTPFAPLSPAARDAVADEAAALLRLLAPEDAHDLAFADPW